LGCDVVSIAEPNVSGVTTNTDLFDHRNPVHLQQLCETVKAKQADLGIAYDTEGTGLAIVDSSGHIIWSDRVMMVLAADVLQTFPGADILFDSDGLSALAKTVTQYGGKLQAHSTGEDTFSILAINNMPLAGNMNGQFVFADRWLHYPDALYTSARLLEILSVDDESSEEVFSTLPDYTGAQPFFSAINEINALGLLEKWEQKLMQSQGTSVSTDDGLRIEVANIGWMVVRYEKQQGGLVFRFQSASDEGLQTLMKSFKNLVPKNAGLKLPF
jgi:phosphomannomutase/phosphoglucomutase